MSRVKLLKSIAATIVDYRNGEVPTPDAKHVETWISQFDEDVQYEILAEVDHVLGHTYISKKTVEGFLQNLTTNGKLTGKDPETFWSRAGILNIQGAGNSQEEMLEMFDRALQHEHEMSLEDCDGSSGTYLYIDDVVFSGGHVRNDLTRWIENDAPKDADVHIVAMALHSGGQFYADREITKYARARKKNIRTHWWRILEVENRKAYINQSDILSPTQIPDDELTREYVAMLVEAGYPPVLRKGDGLGNAKFFSSPKGRELLEQEFLKKGADIRSQCPNLNDYQRPLGNMVLKTLGFGGLIVTFRNCANNCPLAFWVGDPWYPLFERKTN